MFGITDLSVDFLTGRPLVTGLIFLLFLVFSIYMYRRTNPPLPRGIRAILAGLRILAVVALFLALFEPVMSYRREYHRRPALTLLLDRSLSMEITEDGRNRSQVMDSILSSERMRDFLGNFKVDRAAFAGNLAEDVSDLDRDKTALGEVLADQAKREAGMSKEAWLLMSDGISNEGVSPLAAARSLKTPLYAIGIGREAPEKDAAITGLDYNDVVFAGKPTELTVHLQWSGMNNDRAGLSVQSGRKKLQEKTLRLPSGELKESVVIKFVPEKPGRQTFQVEIDGIDDESSTKNNQRSFAMSVLKSKLNVMLIADHMDWEYSFMKRFLDRSESVDLTPVVFNEDGGLILGNLPSRQEEINQYDLIILYDIQPHRLKSKAALFDSFLKDKGGGLFVLLGENYLRSNFPRWIDDYLPFVSARKYGRPFFYKFNGQPVENFIFHPAVRIGESRRDIRKAWQELPHFEMIVPVDSVAPNSDILVATSAEDSGLPVLGFRNVGPGKVLAATAAPFWHWAFFGYGFGEETDEYDQFLNGVVNWLSFNEDADPIRINPDKDIFTRGEAVGFNASVYDLGFRPITGAAGHVTLSEENSPDSIISQFIETGNGQYRSEFDLIPPGRYDYTGIIEKDGRKLKETSGQIAVESFSIEEFRRRPDFSLLSSVAQATGGSFYRPGEIDSLFSRIDTTAINMSVQNEIIIWNKFWLLALFIAALGLEWFLRKRYQLI